MPQIAKVAVAAATYAIDKPYDYLAPEGLGIAVGSRVLVPFGRGNRTGEAVVLSLYHTVPEKPLKAIRECLDDEPILTQRELKLALWMRQRYFCTLYDAIRTVLPAAVWYRYREIWQMTDDADHEGLSERELAVCQAIDAGVRDTEALKETFGESVMPLLRGLKKRGILRAETVSHRKVSDKSVRWASLAVDGASALAYADSKQKKAPRQSDALRFLVKHGETACRELCYFTGAATGTLKALEKRGLIRLQEREAYRIGERACATEAVPITLNEEQQSVFSAVLAQSLSGQAGVTLLHGVTGSGKTLVYIRLAQELLKAGKSVMILVPEIALTPQMMARFTAYFGDEVALLHSALRDTERYDQWKRIRRGEAHIVLGTRSAVFAPLQNIGLIVLDEEQEGSYESENAPCYHARDIAKYRCVQEGARLLLGSATPTVETNYYAGRGDYQLLRMERRYNNKELPRVIVADMRRELRSGNTSSISRELYEELKENLRRGEQSILFLNRRGNSRQLLCPACGYVPQCPRCSVYLTYHSANGRLMCHYCGHSEKAAENCPECGGKLKHIGTGTQKVEEELHELFPDTPVLRMDADTVGEGHEKLLRAFEVKKIPILLGTQMVAKGLDFENVTLVGVLAADLSLYVDHYRAGERTFSLLTQVVGRAGRGEKEGRAVIQTYTPQNDVIQAAAVQDYERFYDGEIRLRRLRRDPPFADQFMMTVTGLEEERVRRACGELRNSLIRVAKEYDMEVLGPAPAPVLKVNHRYRYRLTLIGHNDKATRELLAAYMKEFARRGENRGMNIYTDCNLMD